MVVMVHWQLTALNARKMHIVIMHQVVLVFVTSTGVATTVNRGVVHVPQLASSALDPPMMIALPAILMIANVSKMQHLIAEHVNVMQAGRHLMTAVNIMVLVIPHVEDAMLLNQLSATNVLITLTEKKLTD
jgi:hypothetical protein